jgi:hypothetical protein
MMYDITFLKAKTFSTQLPTMLSFTVLIFANATKRKEIYQQQQKSQRERERMHSILSLLLCSLFAAVPLFTAIIRDMRHYLYGEP